MEFQQFWTSKNHSKSTQLQRLIGQYPEVADLCGLLKFHGRWQRDTQVSDVRGAVEQRETPAGDIYAVVEFIMLLPGRHAAQVRRQAAELFVRLARGSPKLDLALPGSI